MMQTTLIGAGLVAVVASGCVENDTIEVRWGIGEVNGVDGESARRERTCAGALIDTALVEVWDSEEYERGPQSLPRREQTVDCEAATEGYISVSGIRPALHDYVVRARFRRADHNKTEPVDRGTVLTSRAEIDPVEGTVAPVDLGEWRPDPVDLTLRFQSTALCERMAAKLVYAAPETQLRTPVQTRRARRPLPDDPSTAFAGEPKPFGEETAYRDALQTDEGLVLDGHSQPCSSVRKVHRLSDLDPGEYRLLLHLDGNRLCPVELTMVADRTQEIDLAHLDCAGVPAGPL